MGATVGGDVESPGLGVDMKIKARSLFLLERWEFVCMAVCMFV